MNTFTQKTYLCIIFTTKFRFCQITKKPNHHGFWFAFITQIKLFPKLIFTNPAEIFPFRMFWQAIFFHTRYANIFLMNDSNIFVSCFAWRRRWTLNLNFVFYCVCIIFSFPVQCLLQFSFLVYFYFTWFVPMQPSRTFFPVNTVINNAIII